MSDEISASLDPGKSPVSGSDEGRDPAAPTPRIGEPATESSRESADRERDAVGDGPDAGGITLEDDAPERNERPNLGAPLGSTTGQVPPPQ